MAFYRLYELTGPTNRVEKFEEFEAAGDMEAIARAEDFLRHNPMELWSQHRKVHRWHGLTPATSFRNGPS